MLRIVNSAATRRCPSGAAKASGDGLAWSSYLVSVMPAWTWLPVAPMARRQDATESLPAIFKSWADTGFESPWPWPRSSAPSAPSTVLPTASWDGEVAHAGEGVPPRRPLPGVRGQRRRRASRTVVNRSVWLVTPRTRYASGPWAAMRTWVPVCSWDCPGVLVE